jgi:hypothetical protein
MPLKRTERVRRQRIALFTSQQGLCWWCKKPMYMPDDGRFDPGHHPMNAATIDHLHERGHPERGKHAGESTHVLACRRCNSRRGVEHGARLMESGKARMVVPASDTEYTEWLRADAARRAAKLRGGHGGKT